MQRYFVKAESFNEHSVTLEGDDAHHLVRVMRMKPGDEIIVSDGEGREAVAKLSGLAPGRVEADILELRPVSGEPGWSVTVAQALPKGDKMELVIQKGTEIGAAAFVPFQSERMVVQYDERKEGKRLERWRKIAKEAAEQAHRSIIPAVRPVLGWRGLVASLAQYDSVFFCYEKEGGLSGSGLRDAVRAAASQAADPSSLKLLVIVGPEGGFTEREASEAEAAGAVTVGLGKRILRTETAAMVALACLMYESGEMGGST
ncbi:16S rRNA methyltransferase [Paenibacillus darwinianus]|uniref:Ribosomal RNA small subunit methyltransferase E n=1 Tax=Paenibacillus darwinianus TaxID=1380763 RepID=A0A9W5S1R8_9BACL|nr:16S rRNA (uracil(1498)-N(3))-methyltransferase [Paenibacillus darwinianus]EXX87977.1 16S rRNA methyltransferase [Paenibacillus darwinianus]EXX88035.1 16S rRNA methyltransferase [Paenibacillus darwinianus]EXX89205.1 16S rRNA methyltransferase [Paenibacillus darwinianus]